MSRSSQHQNVDDAGAPTAAQAQDSAVGNGKAVYLESTGITLAESAREARAPNRNALSVSYRVEGTVSLPSDGQAHKLTIAAFDFKAALKYVCVPQKNQAAYIMGTVKNTSDYDLLAGPVSVFMDDSFVTKTSVEVRAVFQLFLSMVSD